MVGLSSNRARQRAAPAQGLPHRRATQRRLVRGARRNAVRSGQKISTRDFVTLLDNINLAGDLGAETVWLKSDDVVRRMLEFARENGITRIMVGRTHQPLWRRLLRRDVTKRLLTRRDRFRHRGRRRRGLRRGGQRVMSTPSLRTRIRNGSLLLVIVVITRRCMPCPASTGSAARSARRSIATTSASRPRSTCTRRCASCELAERDGHARDALPRVPARLSCTGSISRTTTSPKWAKPNWRTKSSVAASSSSRIRVRAAGTRATIANSTSCTRVSTI